MESRPPIQKQLSARCPICANGLLHITRLNCPDCATAIETDLMLPRLLRLPPDLVDFMLTFVSCRGNIREVEKELQISYPTVCKRLDLLNELLGQDALEAAVEESTAAQAAKKAASETHPAQPT